MYELLTGEASVDEVMAACRRCDLIPASRHNKRLSIIDAAIGDMPNKLYHLREALLAVRAATTSPSSTRRRARDTLAYNALTAADGAVIPAEAAEYSLDGIADLADSIEMTRRYTNPDLAIIGILMTQHRGQTRVARGMAANASEMASALGRACSRSPSARPPPSWRARRATPTSSTTRPNRAWPETTGPSWTRWSVSSRRGMNMRSKDFTTRDLVS